MIWGLNLKRVSSSARIGCPRLSSTTTESSKTTSLESHTHIRRSQTSAPATRGPTGKVIRSSTIWIPRIRAADLTPTSAAATASQCILRILPPKMQGRWLARPRQQWTATWNQGAVQILLADMELHKDQLERAYRGRFRGISTLLLHICEGAAEISKILLSHMHSGKRDSKTWLSTRWTQTSMSWWRGQKISMVKLSIKIKYTWLFRVSRSAHVKLIWLRYHKCQIECNPGLLIKMQWCRINRSCRVGAAENAQRVWRVYYNMQI